MGWALTIGYGRFLARRGLVFNELPTGRLASRGGRAIRAVREWLSRRGWGIAQAVTTRKDRAAPRPGH
jgi:hypothetical protein